MNLPLSRARSSRTKNLMRLLAQDLMKVVKLLRKDPQSRGPAFCSQTPGARIFRWAIWVCYLMIKKLRSKSSIVNSCSGFVHLGGPGEAGPPKSLGPGFLPPYLPLSPALAINDISHT